MVDDLHSEDPNYINRCAPDGSPTADRWREVRFRGLKPLQAAELNEMQTILRRGQASLGDAIFKPGGVVDGAVPQIIGDGSDDPNVRLYAGLIYFDGHVNSVPQQEIAIPFDAKVQVGIRYHKYEMGPTDDPLLRDQQEGARNFGEDGAIRLVAEWVWGWKADNDTDDGYPDASWEFIPIYVIDHGVIVAKDTPAVSNATLDLVARYDRESNGNYIAGGLILQFVRETGGNYLFSLTAGTANVDGYKIDFLTDSLLTYPVNPDTQTVTGESHSVVNDVDGKYQMTLNREPLAQITYLSGIKRKAVDFVGHVAGASEEIPTLLSVYSVIEVRKGMTVYTPTTDYIVAGDNIDWSPGGAEPAPGETYSITFAYTHIIIDTVNSVTDVDHVLDYQGREFIVLKGLENSTPVNINYSYKLPRIDLISVNGSRAINFLDTDWKDNVIRKTSGVPQRRNPAAPRVANHQIGVAEIYYDWVNPPDVRNISVRAVQMDVLVEMIKRLATLEDYAALIDLKTDRALRDPAIKKNTFVDAFRNEDQRDTGISQTASINQERMLCPIDGSIVSSTNLSNRAQWWSLPYSLVTLIEQPLRTGCMKINPYQAFDRPPSRLTLTPNTDRWEVVTTTFTSPKTQIWDVNSSTAHRGAKFGVWQRTTVDEIVNSNSTETPYMRSQLVEFEINDFLPGENLVTLTFDGVDLTPAGPLTADSDGNISGSFTIPSNTAAGTKTVTAIGSAVTGPSRASAAYMGQHIITTQQLQRVTTLLRGRYDPLAQTFTLPEARQIGAINLKFCAKGNVANDVYVQIREAELGLPTQEVLSEAVIAGSAITTGGAWVTATFPVPVALSADQEYAIVILTDDAIHALSIAELGARWDEGGGNVGFVSAQPYTIGELLSSSNASTWTPHPTKDLCFQMLACNFTSNTRTVEYGNIAFSNTTDVVVKASVLRAAADNDVDWVLTELFTPPGLLAPQVHHLSEDQALQLAQLETGNVAVQAVLKGNSKLSPIVYPEPQFALGTMATSGTYFSQGFAADADFKITVTFEVFKPGSANCTPAVQRQQMSGGNPVITGGVYQSEYVALSKTGVQRLEDGWVEETYKSHPDIGDPTYGTWTPPSLRGVGLDYITRCRLTLAATARDRVYVRRLRVVIK